MSICGHGLNMHHNLLPHKDTLTGINHQLFHRQGGPYKLWGSSRKSLATSNTEKSKIFSYELHFFA